jgi:hypothetical protein
MMDGQFNPFIRESTPPLVNSITIKKYDEWGWCDGIIPYRCRKAAYTRIWVDVIDVSPYTITIKINNDDDRSRTFEVLGGREDFQTSFDLSGWEILHEYTVTVEMVDFSGNELDPKYEQVIRGVVGEIAKRLGDLWDWLCGVAGAIAEAMGKLLSFLFDLILNAIKALLRPLLDRLE